MNENSQPQALAIKDWVTQATSQLAGVGIGTAKLDAELILSHTLRKSRTWIHMYRDEPLSSRLQEVADARIQLRLDRVPLAYIIGHKEFYGRRFLVTPATLIPRPESEAMIESLKELLGNSEKTANQNNRLVDVGTGSGCLGITAKLEFPWLDVSLLDTSRHALAVAKRNAQTYRADVAITRSNLLASYPLAPDIIIANLPYVDVSWERSPETDHEPAEALFAVDDGLNLIMKLIVQTADALMSGGYLLLEADPVQHETIRDYCLKHGLTHVLTRDYCTVFRKN